MAGLGQSLNRHLGQARNVEGFVRRIVAGGIALVAGLWVGALTQMWSGLWLAGVVLSLAGLAALASGLWSEIES